MEKGLAVGLLWMAAGCSQPPAAYPASMPATPPAPPGHAMPARYRICWTDGQSLFRMRPESLSVEADPLPQKLTPRSAPDPGPAIYPSAGGLRVATESLALLQYSRGGYVSARLPPLDSQKFPRRAMYDASVSDAAALLAFGYGGIRTVDDKGRTVRQVPYAIGVLDLRTGAARSLVAQEGHGAHVPCWSPDGAWLAYATISKDPFHAVKGVWKVRADNGKAERLSKEFAQVILWSPKGTYLSYFTHADRLFKDREALVVLNAADGSPVFEIDGGMTRRGSWGWLPDEAGLVYVDRDQSVWKTPVPPGTGAPVRLVDGKQRPSLFPREVCVSPDGRHVYFTTRPLNTGQGYVERVSLGGGASERLTGEAVSCQRLYLLHLPFLPPPDQATQAEIVRRISELGEKAFPVREAASRNLEDLGHTLDLGTCLSEALSQASDPEVQERLRKLLRIID